MAFNILPAEPAERCVEWLVRSYHPALLTNAVRIVCRFRDDLPMSQDREVWYGVKKLSGFEAFEANPEIQQWMVEGNEEAEAPSADPFFLIWFSLPVWKRMKDLERLALVDQALCHCHAGKAEASGRVILSKKRPDAVLFFENVERFGAWHEDVRAAAQALESGDQIGLPLELGPLNARVSEKQAGEVLGSTEAESVRNVAKASMRGRLQIVGTGTLEPGDLDAAPLLTEADLVGSTEAVVLEERAADPGVPETAVGSGDDAPAAVEFVTLAACGHEVAADEVAEGKPCPHCEVAAGLAAAAPPDTTVQEVEADRTIEGWEKHRRGRRKKQQAEAA